MEEMKITDGFFGTIVSKILERVIKKKLGCDAKVAINNLLIKKVDNVVRIHIDIDGEMNEKEFKELVMKNM